LKVTVKPAYAFSQQESFYARLNRDGRITIPQLTLEMLRDEEDEEKSLAGTVIDVQIEPAEDSS
jgi:hypothetical protein